MRLSLSRILALPPWLGLVLAAILLATPAVVSSHAHDGEHGSDSCVACAKTSVSSIVVGTSPAAQAPIVSSERIHEPAERNLPAARTTSSLSRAPPTV